MKVIISKYAQNEIEDSKEYYNFQQTSLGDLFVEDVRKSIDSISSFPNLYPNITDKIKRCLLHRFTYSIFYSINDDTVLILSVAHQHRKPKY